eukprot:g3675.t1
MASGLRAARAISVSNSEKDANTKILDPWKKYKSPYGGSLSPHDEWQRIENALLGPQLVLSSEDVKKRCDMFSKARKGKKAKKKQKGKVKKRKTGMQNKRKGIVTKTKKKQLTIAGFSEEELTSNEKKITHKAELKNTIPDEEANDKSVEVAEAKFEQLWIAATDPPVENIEWTEAMTKSLVSISCPGCRLSAKAIPGWGKWLRILCLASCGLKQVPPLSSFPRLLVLDLCDNPLCPELPDNEKGSTKVPKTAVVLKHVSEAKELRELRLSRCGLHDLGSTSTWSPQLVRLDLANNCIVLKGAGEYFKPLYQLRRLVSLDVRGNIRSTTETMKENDLFDSSISILKKRLSCLKQIDGLSIQSVQMQKAVIDFSKPFSQVQFEDKASCSCLEGNPCVSRYSCKNFEKRFEIAKAARIKKHGKDPLAY